jgi:hypothetical protein
MAGKFIRQIKTKNATHQDCIHFQPTAFKKSLPQATLAFKIQGLSKYFRKRQFNIQHFILNQFVLHKCFKLAGCAKNIDGT